jgi:hypothetical protein
VSCSFATWDGAYVLGSLSTSDRREFESHLAGCDTCSRAVRDLAGMPGLLGRLEPEIFDEGDPEPVPDTLLPRLIDAMHRGQRRRTWLTAGLAAAAAVVVTVGGALVLEHAESGAPEAVPPSSSATSAPPATTVVLKPVGAETMTASVALTTVGWGTRLDLTCTYAAAHADQENVSYALVVHTTDGRTQRVGTWNGLPGRTMQLTAATATPEDDISSVEVTWLDGSPVVRGSL